jgi:hypothetical protein
MLERLRLYSLSQTVASFRKNALAPSPFSGVSWLAEEGGSSQQPREPGERCGRQQLEGDSRHLAAVAIQIMKSERRTRLGYSF